MTSKTNLLAITLAVAAISSNFCSGTATAVESTLKIVRSEPEVGRMAKDFELEVAAGQRSGTVRLSEITGEGPVVIAILRGFPGSQCPACAGQVADLVRHAHYFQARNAEVLLVYPGPASELKAKSKDFLEDTKLPAPFTMLLDPDYQLVSDYGLRWDAPHETAYPTTIVIGKDGKIDFVNISRTHRGRTTATTILDQL
ncbi:peroxiredoxin-like family protein [Rhodopirellula baltica]|uniref:thioredoxin-dependent peroxiredoxin n=1 Tax=Rhodopirellula baltica WH47 TaxID=991778 RepID=F2AW87_RHOBT|nr:peroxiredoxin-like family protein [Rhodopirellula baltica]EGF26069.1 alkyl hydroperoxide reductase/ Thiol specific antioxidant/ Mal allergen [Rhodopirellula baltica WH47]